VDTELGREVFVDIFDRYSRGEITKAGIGEVIKSSPKSSAEVKRIIKEKSLARISGSALKEMVDRMSSDGRKDIVKELMSKYRLNVDGEELNKLVGGGG
jgi:Glu-tRNA(Gln) amidotransferase subunit E-like FAD-binding protein